MDAILAAISERSRFDLHAYDTVRWMIATFAALPPPPAEWLESQGQQLDLEEMHAIQSLAMWMAIAIPSFQPVSDTCRGYAMGASTQRRYACLRLAQVLAESSDSAIGQLFGLGLLEDMAGTPAERADARAQRRRFDWRMQQWIEVSRGLPNNGATDFARLLRDPSIRTEEQLMLRQLREAGVASDPPTGWESPRGERPPPSR